MGDTSYYTTFQVVRQPFVTDNVSEDGKTIKEFIGWDLDGDGILDALPATSHLSLQAQAMYKTHHLSDWLIYDLTCTTDGYREIICLDCGKVFEHEGLTAPGHDYEAVVTAPTCTEQGFTTHTCSRCNDSYADTYVEATGHSFGQWTMETEPTCTADGSEKRVCHCGQTEIRAVAKLGHDYEAVVTAPTCTEQGFTTHTCSRCNDSYADTYVEANGHSFSEWEETVKPTCTADGSEKRVCHCGQTEIRAVAKLGHDYEAVVTAPTCTEQGFTTHTCSRCSDTYVDSHVEATGHSFGQWTMETEPTCTADGSEKRVCYCGETEIQSVAKLGHDYEAVVTAPTCTEQGFTTHACSRCSDTYVDSYVEANGHSFGEWEEAVKPTCTADGSEKRVCHCGETESHVLKQLGHDYETKVTEPTYTDRGYTTHSCTRCGDSFVDSYTEPLPVEPKEGCFGAISGMAALLGLLGSAVVVLRKKRK